MSVTDVTGTDALPRRLTSEMTGSAVEGRVLPVASVNTLSEKPISDVWNDARLNDCFLFLK